MFPDPLAVLIHQGCSLHNFCMPQSGGPKLFHTAPVCKCKGLAQDVVLQGLFLGADAHLRLEDLDQLQFASALQLKALNSTPPVASRSCWHRRAKGSSSPLSAAANPVTVCVTALEDASQQFASQPICSL